MRLDHSLFGVSSDHSRLLMTNDSRSKILVLNDRYSCRLLEILSLCSMSVSMNWDLLFLDECSSLNWLRLLHELLSRRG